MKPVEAEFQAAERAFLRNPAAVIPETEQCCREECYAQVETLVLPKSIGGLKPGGITWNDSTERTDDIKRPSPLTVRMSPRQKQIIRTKAGAAGISVNRFVLAAALGSEYRPPADPNLTRALLSLNRELSAQGNNLNQIARQLNAGIVVRGQGAMLEALILSIQETLRDIRQAFAKDRAAEGA